MLFDFVKKKLGIFWSVSVLIPSQKVFARFESLLKLSSFFFSFKVHVYFTNVLA